MNAFASLGSEPSKVIKPRRGRLRFVMSTTLILCRRSAALNKLLAITQGSQSLALGLTLTAAPQLASHKTNRPRNRSRRFGVAGVALPKGSLLRHLAETLLIDLLYRDGDSG